jgi:hypothetical protein
MRPALDPAGHRVPRTKPTCLLHTWRPHRRRPFVLVLHLHQHQSSCNLHLQYLAKNQSTQRCQSLITQGRDHPPVLEPHKGTPFEPILEPTSLRAPHMSYSRANDGEGAHEQDGEQAPIASNGPRLGGRTHGNTSWICTERRQVSIRAHGTAMAG